MRVAIQIEYFDPERGGAEVYTELLARYLLEQGHQVEVMAMNWAHAPEGIEMVPVPVRSPAKWQRWIEFSNGCAALVRQRKPDRVIAMTKGGAMDIFLPHSGTVIGDQRQNVMRQQGVLAKLVKQLSMNFGIRAVVARRLDKQSYKTAKRVIALSRMVRQDIIRYHQVSEDQIRLIYNGVDTKIFHPDLRQEIGSRFRERLGIGHQETVFAIVAQDFSRKGVDWMIRAAARLKNRQARWLVAGKGRIDRFQRLARRCGVEEKFEFLGPVRPIQQVYAAADVYVHPAWYDPCSLVVLEAFAMGLPVVTTAFNGAGELITEGIEGFVVPRPDSPNELADRMESLLDPIARRRMGQAARALAERNTWLKHYRAIEELLEEV